MRSLFVIVSTPSLQLFASVLQVQEPVSVKALAAQLAVEGFDKGVVRRVVRPGEVHHTALVSPQIHVPRDKLATVVYAEGLGVADLSARPVPRRDDLLTAIAEPGIDHRR